MAFSTTSYFFTSPNFSGSHRPSTSPTPATAVQYPKPNSLYDVLGVQIGADTVEIKAAYRRLARTLHPDVGNCDSSADEFMKVHSAYATLSDPGKRADYDRSLVVREKMGVRSKGPVGYGGYSGRRWETDQCW